MAARYVWWGSGWVTLSDGDGPFLGNGVTLTARDTFQPSIGLVGGSSASIEWRDNVGTLLATGATPTIECSPTGSTVVMRVHNDGVQAIDEVDFINFGFDYTQDAGRYNLGSSYNWPNQEVTAIAGLTYCTNLRAFMAAENPLGQTVDFTGLSNLEFIECYRADVTGVVLDGCTSLIRLCLEQCHVTGTLDLSPVAGNLYDLRGAYQFQSGSAQISYVTDAPMAHLYHYCVRRNDVQAHIAMEDLPVVEELWAWDTGITDWDDPVSTVLDDVRLYDNPISSAMATSWLIALDNLGVEDGNLRMDDADPPSGSSDTARANLIAKDWTVNVPASSGGDVAPEITTTTLNSMAETVVFSQQLQATGVPTPTWAVTSGTAPDGLSLSSGGLLSGTPTTAGSYDFTVTATNSEGSDVQQYTGTVAEEPSPSAQWPDGTAVDEWVTVGANLGSLSVDSGDLLAPWTANGYGRVFRDFGTTTTGDVTVTVTVTREELEARDQYWGILVGAGSDGNGGCRVLWLSDDVLDSTPTIGQSDTYNTLNSSVTRQNPNPAGWVDSGEHTIAVRCYYPGSGPSWRAEVYWDDVLMFTSTLNSQVTPTGDYHGFCGDARSGNTRRWADIEVTTT